MLGLLFARRRRPQLESEESGQEFDGWAEAEPISRRQGTGHRCPVPWLREKKRGVQQRIGTPKDALTVFDRTPSTIAGYMHEYTNL